MNDTNKADFSEEILSAVLNALYEREKLSPGAINAKDFEEISTILKIKLASHDAILKSETTVEVFINMGNKIVEMLREAGRK